MYREILTKAIIAKGEKDIKETRSVLVNKNVSKVLGCWLINNNLKVTKENQKIFVVGTYDAYLWYGYDNNTSCDLFHEKFSYSHEIPYTFTLDTIFLNEDMQVKEYVDKLPTCVAMNYENETITIEVEYKFSIDIIGETKLKIKVDDVAIDQMINTNYVKENK